jgi:hypothetical protein
MGGNIVCTQQFYGNEGVHLDKGGVDGTIKYVRVDPIHVSKLYTNFLISFLRWVQINGVIVIISVVIYGSISVLYHSCIIHFFMKW